MDTQIKLVKAFGILIPVFFGVVVIFFYQFLWPALLLITVSHVPLKVSKK